MTGTIMLPMAQVDKKKPTTTVRWEIPDEILEGVKAAHLIHGEGSTLQEYVSARLLESTPPAFRKDAR